MAKFRKQPKVVDATQWFKNGDHPEDSTHRLPDGSMSEGRIVRYFRRPDVDGNACCQKCQQPFDQHGWIDTLEGGHIVCPADWIITGVQGEYYPCKPDIFEATYEAV